MSALKGGVKLSELFTGSEAERNEKIDQLFQASLNPTKSQSKEQTQAIEARITKFERRYEMSTATMREELSAGRLKETADVCSWLLLVKAKESFEPKST